MRLPPRPLLPSFALAALLLVPRAPDAEEHERSSAGRKPSAQVESREDAEREEEEEGWEEHFQVLPDLPPGPSIPASYRNPPAAPVVIVEARTSSSPVAEHEHSATSFVPAVRLENLTARTVTGVRLRYKAEPGSHAVSAYEVRILPRRSIVVARPGYEIWGRASEMTVQVLGVRFAGGRTWGSMDSHPDPRAAWVDAPGPRANRRRR